MKKLVSLMGLVPYDKDEETLIVEAPITRSDVLQECDIIEDVCIAYGYSKIQFRLPTSGTVGT